MTSDAGNALLHNMSAPPRATIAFRPVEPRPWSPCAAMRNSGTSEDISANGLRWICRIDVVNQFWPVEPGVPRDIAEGIDWLQTRAPDRHALAHSLAIERGTSIGDRSLVAHVTALSAEAVCDELREVARRAVPGLWDLPPIALITTAVRSPPRPATDDVRLSVTVLARTRGTIFVRAADPISLTVVRSPFDLWAPVSAPGAGRS